MTEEPAVVIVTRAMSSGAAGARPALSVTESAMASGPTYLLSRGGPSADGGPGGENDTPGHEAVVNVPAPGHVSTSSSSVARRQTRVQFGTAAVADSPKSQNQSWAESA